MICAALAEKYTAPVEQITNDTLTLLADLADKRLLDYV
jgi:hypothetical protein